jgi:hypothetical protein
VSLAKPSRGNAAAATNPHKIPINGPAFTAFPRVLSSEAFGRRPYTGSTARDQAGIRNPSGKGDVRTNPTRAPCLCQKAG